MREDELYQGLLKRDPASIEYLISAYGTCVYRLVSRILGEAGSAADIATVRIPEKGVQELVETVTMGIDGDTVEAIRYPGSAVKLDHKLSLGRFSLILNSAEIITYPEGDYLRINVESKTQGKEKLIDFLVFHAYKRPRHRREIADFSQLQPYINSYNSLTGHLEYIELPLQESKGMITITFKYPVYAVEGPWIFNISVPKLE